MQERARELKATKNRADGEKDVLARIAQMHDPDRSMATRIHEIVGATAPELSPRTWYGMPAYTKDDKAACHFKPAEKFKTRYATLGFSDKANLDTDAMWPVEFALNNLTATEEAPIASLIKKAVT
jgi:uncharacterized protein YdhG (YjbR/CyaY superfamily)